MPQFDLLYALSVGETQNKNEFKKALTQIIIKHKKGAVKDRAQELLTLLKIKNTPKTLNINDIKTTIKTDSTAIINDTLLFKLNSDTTYYYITMLNKKADEVKNLKELVKDLASKNFKNDSLKIIIETYTIDTQLIISKTFKNKKRTDVYHNYLLKNKKIFSDLKSKEYLHFIITENNYQLLIKNKALDKYLLFYQKNYQ
jgi:hypothetical protein